MPKKILISEPEWKHAHGKDKIRYIPSMWEGVNIETFSFKSSDYGPCNASYDLMRDGTILCIHTPGHTEGLTTVMIRSQEKICVALWRYRLWNKIMAADGSSRHCC